MTIWTSVGKSHYRGDVLGIEQFMEQAAARQVLALIAYIATLPGCRRLTVNEGRRTRARQRTLRQRYEAFLRGGPWAPLAAVLFTSRHDEVNHGNAADLGGPDGEALNAAEIAAIKKYGPDFGVQFTGLTFSPPEPWHVEADGRTPIPQYALASLDAALFPESEEDELNTAEKGQLASAFRDAASAMQAANTAAAEASAAAIDAYQTRLMVKALHQAVFDGGPDMPDGGRSVGRSLEGLAKVVDRIDKTVNRKVRRDKKATVMSARDDLILDQVDDDTQANTGVRMLLQHFGLVK